MDKQVNKIELEPKEEIPRISKKIKRSSETN